MNQNIPLVHLQNFKILDCKRPTFVIYNSLTNGRFSFNVEFQLFSVKCLVENFHHWKKILYC